MGEFRIGLVIGIGLLVGCADFPDLNSAVTERGLTSGLPRLVQVDGLFGVDPRETERIEKIAKSLAARARRLKRRARSLRGPVIQQQDRRKMLAALARHPIANSH